MRRPHVRLTVRLMMVVVAALALPCWWAIRRPCPKMVSCSALCSVIWSDGSTTITPAPPRFRGNSWLLIVDWDDGSTGYYVSQSLVHERNR